MIISFEVAPLIESIQNFKALNEFSLVMSYTRSAPSALRI